jgi:hypothetical protein
MKIGVNIMPLEVAPSGIYYFQTVNNTNMAAMRISYVGAVCLPAPLNVGF